MSQFLQAANVTQDPPFGLVCIHCRSALRPEREHAATSLKDVSTLQCTQCGRKFPVRAGVARLVENLEGDLSGTASSYGYQWQGFWQGAFDSRDVFGLQFDETAAYFLRSLDLTRQQLHGRRVLDAGTGSGRVPLSIHGMGCTVHAVDMHSGIEAVAKLLTDVPNVTVTQANLLTLPFPDDYFDVAWSTGVLMYSPDASQVFRSIARTVKPGGRFFISVYGKDVNHYRMFRHLLPWAHKLPLPLLYALSSLIGVPLYIGFGSVLWALRTFRGGTPPPYRIGPFTAEDISHKSYKSIVLNLFDQLHPQFQSEHSVEEVLGWFESAGFVETSVTESIGMVAVRGIKKA